VLLWPEPARSRCFHPPCPQRPRSLYQSSSPIRRRGFR
jgi:hypothetical protein